MAEPLRQIVKVELEAHQLKVIIMALETHERVAIKRAQQPDPPGAIAARRARRALHDALDPSAPSAEAAVNRSFRRLRRRSSNRKGAS